MDKRVIRILGSIALCFTTASLAFAQEGHPTANTTTATQTVRNPGGTYTVIQYPMGREVVVDLRPTTMIPGAKGRAWIVRKANGTAINLDLSGLTGSMNSFNLYAIDPAGHVTPLGPVAVTNGNATYTTTTPLDRFMLVLSPDAKLMTYGPNTNVVLRSAAPAAMATRTQVLIAEEVRHQLLTLPHYDVFDWLNGAVRPDGTVVLRGEVVRPTTKSDAEARVSALGGVSRVENHIEVLPLSPEDDRLRVAIYRAIYNVDSPLFRYATQAVPPIHIIVKNGRAVLKGAVATKADSDLASNLARGVPGVFDVSNELSIENQAPR